MDYAPAAVKRNEKEKNTLIVRIAGRFTGITKKRKVQKLTIPEKSAITKGRQTGNVRVAVKNMECVIIKLYAKNASIKVTHTINVLDNPVSYLANQLAAIKVVPKLKFPNNFNSCPRVK